MNIVWDALVDQRYKIQVIRTADPYEGILQVFDGQMFLRDFPVGLSYGAKFGPDIHDVETWQNIAIDFIDILNN